MLTLFILDLKQTAEKAQAQLKHQKSKNRDYDDTQIHQFNADHPSCNQEQPNNLSADDEPGAIVGQSRPVYTQLTDK